jgi:hypothetical protein
MKEPLLQLMKSSLKIHTLLPCSRIWLFGCAVASLCLTLRAAPFDAAPFGLPLPEGNGVMWEDPREIHKVVVHFAGAVPMPEKVRVEYWGSRWPEQHLPKDREPGGGSVGWTELGNWYTYKWRVADAEARADGNTVTIIFRPVNAKEFSKLKDYPAAFRYTLKLRVVSEAPLPKIERIEAFTDSTLEPRSVKLAWKSAPAGKVSFEVFNGGFETAENASSRGSRLKLRVAANPDPNTFDRTLVTVRNGQRVFTFAVDDLKQGALFLPHAGVAVLPEGDARDYAAVASAQKAAGGKTLYDRVAEMPEQTWRAAWEGMPPKKSHIYLPLGLDSGRQRFQLDADGTVRFRSNDPYLRRRAGKETPRFALEAGPVRFRFQPPLVPVFRTIEEACLPIGHTVWETNGVRISQTAFATELDGARADGPVPAADKFAVFLAKFVFTNITASPQVAAMPMTYKSGDSVKALRSDDKGLLWLGDNVRGHVLSDKAPVVEAETLSWTWTLAPGESKTVIVKIPYSVLTEKSEQAALAALDFEKEKREIAGYWRRRLDESARLITPELMLNEFYRAHAGHLLINCEGDPDSAGRRFARVGSFAYGAYGNESCMMVVDLERRGYHKEAQECLDAWLHYQGTAALPGDFSTKQGVLYGAGGVEEGGYNQHHGWILWMLGEHYRFTRDEAWLRGAVPGILAGADWIINETKRTANRHELERGLLPAGSLEDIGDWWTWLSTSCYTWRGLDSAAWALEQIKHPEAPRVRKEADTYHANLLANFRKAADRSPVVRLRDGTAVPHIPSMVHRRGRYFGWICETLEGSLHLLITGALDPRSPEAEWILKDYEDNRYISNQYGYLLDDFEKHWFGRGGMSMQACLLLDVEPYLYRDDVKQALRALFNAEAAQYFPDERMNTEHALPALGDWKGDHYKSSDESNVAGWLRYLFVREEGDRLLVGQAVPREWLRAGQTSGIERTGTYFGPTSVIYTGGDNEITAKLEAPRRNPPKAIRLRFREPGGRSLSSVKVNGKPWKQFKGEWVQLPGDIGAAAVVARYSKK